MVTAVTHLSRLCFNGKMAQTDPPSRSVNLISFYVSNYQTIKLIASVECRYLFRKHVPQQLIEQMLGVKQVDEDTSQLILSTSH